MGKHEKKSYDPAPQKNDAEVTWDFLDVLDDWDKELLSDEDAKAGAEAILTPEPEEAPAAAPALPQLENVVPVTQEIVSAPARSEKSAEPKSARSTANESPRRRPAAKAPAKRPASGKSQAPRTDAGKSQAPRDAGKRPTGKKRRRRRKNRFKKGLRIYVILFLAAIIGILAFFWFWLDKQQRQKDAEDREAERIAQEQAAQQAHARAVHQAPQLAFMSWLEQQSAESWTDRWYAIAPEDLDGRDRVQAYIGELFAAAEPFKSLDYTDAEPVYVLKNGEETLAKIHLTGSETSWSVSTVELVLRGHESASVRVASGSRIYCNGKELGTEYMTDSVSYFDYEPLRDQLINPVSWDTYSVSGMLLPPELTVDPPANRSVTETAEGDFLLCLPEAESGQFQTKAVAFVRSYLYYYMRGNDGNIWGNLFSALGHLTPGTQAYKDLRATYDGVYWNTSYANVDTSKTTAGGVVIWADNCYSVDVTYDADCTLGGQHIDYADATMRIYFLQTDAGFIISHFETL